ncbi:ATP-dependent zinc metalloprotease FtsH, partial [Phycisphaeraceae bacterium AH-315-B13]|nr:ATP-dependent zinc metalloprotease FtsH [Phycisphaeraceae bacterium AH-315-B13]
MSNKNSQQPGPNGTNGKDNQNKPGDNKGQGNKPGQPPSGGRGMFGLFAFIAVIVLLFMLFSTAQQGHQLNWQEFQTHYDSNNIERDSISISDTAITAQANAEAFKEAKSDEPVTVQVKFRASASEHYTEKLDELTGGNYAEKPTPGWQSALFFFLPFLVIILIFWFFLSRGLRSAAGGGGMLGNFGKSKHRVLSKEMTGVTFKDVAGIEEAKDEVSEIIEFLKHPKRFAKIGGRIPRGVLLVGEPGCGKTLLAKAIAGEADVPFFSISGSDFVEMFVGVGASRVRDLFKQAKETAPCIIFLDEIDAVGRRRGGGFTTGGHDEREQTLNAILVEMDGFASSDGVIVIAATNRADVLDPALIRPGRFDRQIVVPLPDVLGRLEILKVHAKKIKLGPDVDLERLARVTPMFSGADLAAITNEAAISATLAEKDFVEQEDLEEARDKIRFGRAKKSRVREADENKLTAYHEAGHAMLQAMLKDADPLHKVTIIPRGQFGGATFSLPEKDRMGYNLKWINATLRVVCGGRIAEQIAMNDISSGASQDIAQVTQMARAMIIEWGMSEKLGFVRYAGSDSRESYTPDKDYSDETASLIDSEIRRIVDEAYADA